MDAHSFFGGGSGEALRMTIPRQVLAFVVFAFVFVPVLVILIALLFGAALAGVEAWTFGQGFFFVMSVLLGLPNPLTEVTPDNDTGKLLEVIFVIWGLSIAGTVIGVLASTQFVHTVLKVMERPFSSSVFSNTVSAALDKDPDSKLDYDEFRASFRPSPATQGAQPSLPEWRTRDMWRLLDVDGSGSVTRSELEEYLEAARRPAEEKLFVIERKVQRLDALLESLLRLESTLEQKIAGMSSDAGDGGGPPRGLPATSRAGLLPPVQNSSAGHTLAGMV